MKESQRGKVILVISKVMLVALKEMANIHKIYTFLHLYPAGFHCFLSNDNTMTHLT
jgi:hypothetical protein